MIDNYALDFQWAVYARLGGFEFGREFFDLHEPMFESMRRYALLHAAKGSTIERGVKHFYYVVLAPILQSDRERVNVADYIDPRD